MNSPNVSANGASHLSYHWGWQIQEGIRSLLSTHRIFEQINGWMILSEHERVIQLMWECFLRLVWLTPKNMNILRLLRLVSQNIIVCLWKPVLNVNWIVMALVKTYYSDIAVCYPYNFRYGVTSGETMNTNKNTYCDNIWITILFIV